MSSEVRLSRDEERTIRQALMDLPKVCQYHGTDFEFMGMWRNEPRCESCRVPFRAKRAWEMFNDARDRRDDFDGNAMWAHTEGITP